MTDCKHERMEIVWNKTRNVIDGYCACGYTFSKTSPVRQGSWKEITDKDGVRTEVVHGPIGR